MWGWDRVGPGGTGWDRMDCAGGPVGPTVAACVEVISDCALYQPSARNQAPRFRLEMGATDVPNDSIGVRAGPMWLAWATIACGLMASVWAMRSWSPAGPSSRRRSSAA